MSNFIKIYKDSNGYFVIGNQIVPSKTCALQKRNSDEEIKIINISTNDTKVDWIQVSDILKENDSQYTDLADFLSAMGTFFEAVGGGEPTTSVTANAGTNLNTSLLSLESTQIKLIPSSSGTHISNTSLSDSTATQIDSTSIPCKSCIVTALETNTGLIRIGFSDLTTTTGIVLYPSESVSLPVSNSNILYAIAAVSGEDVTVTILE